MIRPKLILCAEGIVIDQQSNNISVFNIFEDIAPPSYPAIIPRFSILSVLERDPDDPSEFDVSLRITIGVQNIVEQVIHVNFQEKIRSRNIINFGGMPLPQPGLLEVTIFRDNNPLHSYQVHIRESNRPERLS